MKKIIKQKLEFKKEIITKKKALELFKDEPYKLELIKDLDKISIYRTGDFVDLCAGPHVKNTSEIKAVKLLSIAGAYWKGDEKNKMFTRIYGTAFPSKKEKEMYADRSAEVPGSIERALEEYGATYLGKIEHMEIVSEDDKFPRKPSASVFRLPRVWYCPGDLEVNRFMIFIHLKFQFRTRASNLLSYE